MCPRSYKETVIIVCIAIHIIAHTTKSYEVCISGAEMCFRLNFEGGGNFLVLYNRPRKDVTGSRRRPRCHTAAHSRGTESAEAP